MLAAGSPYLDHAWVAKDELQENLPYPALLQLLRDMLWPSRSSSGPGMRTLTQVCAPAALACAQPFVEAS